MSLNQKIESILSDLYKLDASLKEHEKEVKKLISELLAIRPEVKIDESFVIRLRDELSARMTQVKTKEARGGIGKLNLSFFSQMPKMAYAFGGTVAVVVLAIIFVGDFGQDQMFPTGVKISMIEEGAFGVFEINQGEGIVPVVAGGGGGIGLAESDIMSARAPDAQPMPITTKSEIYPSMMPYYAYTYTGDTLEIPAEKMNVLKRIKVDSSGSIARNLLEKIDLGIIDLTSFSGVSLNNFNFTSENDNGYSVNVNLSEGTASIHLNVFSAVMRGCEEGARCMPTPLTLEDVPEDGVLIGVANNFLKAHKISTKDYGAPEVMKSGKFGGLREGESGEVFVSDVSTVIYPLAINGKTVYNQAGNKHSLMVGINLRENKVSSVWNISSHNYQSSLYETEQDIEKILQMAENGGGYWHMPLSPSSQKVDIKLGTPEIGYVLTWKGSDDGRSSNEFLVPAFIFPVAEVLGGDDRLLPVEKVVVPLIKEMFENQGGRGGVFIEPAPDPIEVVVPVNIVEEIGRITFEQANEIAKNSECTEKGVLTDDGMYNDSSKTWWIDLDMKEEFKKDYCNPACVVYEASERAEINWRCMGALPPQ